MRSSSPAPTTSGGLSRPARRWLGFGLLAAALLAAALWVPWRGPVLPVPVPPDLGSLDPQVRSHLAGLVRRISESPRDADLRADLGLAFAVNGLWAQARESFLHAVRLGARGPLPAMYAAVALQELGDDAGAARELREVVGRHPEFAPAWHRLGRVLIATGNLPEAGEAFSTVTRLTPDAWYGWAGLGEARIRAGQPEAAVAPLERAREIDPTARSVRHLLGQAYRAVHRTVEADIESAAGSSQSLTPMPDPWSHRALDHMKLLADQFERADELVARGQPAEAIARLREAFRFHPTNATVIASLARALNAAGQAPMAWELIESAMAQWPDEVLLLSVAADTAATLDRPGEALELARRALARAPKSAEARVAEANALLAAGRDEEALAALQEAAQLAPRNAALWSQLGDLQWHNLGRRDDARETYVRAHRLDPINPGVLHRLAAVEIDLHHFDEAERLLALLQTLHPDPALVQELVDHMREVREAEPAR